MHSVFFCFRGFAETVGWVSLGKRNQHTLSSLLHFPSTDQWLSHSAEMWVWINCHTLTDYLPRMLFCAGRMFEMPVRDILHPPPPTHIMYRWAAVEVHGVVLQSSAGLSLRSSWHILWQCGITRQHVSWKTLWRHWFNHCWSPNTVNTTPADPPLCLSHCKMLSLFSSLFLFPSFLIICFFF